MICDYELNVLRLCAGINVPNMMWGAAMSVALESLEAYGFVKRESGKYRATEKGIELLNDNVSETESHDS